VQDKYEHVIECISAKANPSNLIFESMLALFQAELGRTLSNTEDEA